MTSDRRVVWFALLYGLLGGEAVFASPFERDFNFVLAEASFVARVRAISEEPVVWGNGRVCGYVYSVDVVEAYRNRESAGRIPRAQVFARDRIESGEGAPDHLLLASAWSGGKYARDGRYLREVYAQMPNACVPRSADLYSATAMHAFFSIEEGELKGEWVLARATSLLDSAVAVRRVRIQQDRTPVSLFLWRDVRRQIGE